MPVYQSSSSSSHPYLYLPDGWDTGWKAAKGASATTPAWAAVIGDSITQGTNSTNALTKAWWPQVRSSLLQSYPLYGDYYAWSHASGIAVDANVTFITRGGTSIPSEFNQRGLGTTLRNADTTGTLTFVTPSACTGIDIVYYDMVAGTFQYTVDGGAPQTVTCAGVGWNKTAQIRSLANTTHTIVVSAGSVADAMNINGFSTYTGTNGLGFVWMARSGLASYPFVNTTQVQHWMGKKSDGTFGFGFPTGATLGIFALGINDMQSTTPVGLQRYEYMWRYMIQAFRRANPNCSIILLSPYSPDSVTSDQTSGYFTNGNLWPKYVQVMRRLAHTYNCAHINMQARWGETPVAQGFLTAAQAHPNDTGYADIASVIKGIV